MITRTANAKINMCLHVLGKRDDGYHELQSLVAFAEFGDELTFIGSCDNSEDKLQLNGPFSSSLSNTKSNLIFQALAAFKQRWPDIISPGLKFRLDKNLPVASGIGGGSADAAAMLEILTHISNHPVEREHLLEIAATLGSDVPVCLTGLPTIMSGRGEVMHPIKNFPQIFAVLVNPGISVSTTQVFARQEQINNAALPSLGSGFSGLDDLVEWLKLTRNDLADPAIVLVPQIGDIIEEFQASPNCRFSRMSGSGATVFGLFDTMDQAEKSAVALKTKWPDYWVQPTVLSGAT